MNGFKSKQVYLCFDKIFFIKQVRGLDLFLGFWVVDFWFMEFFLEMIKRKSKIYKREVEVGIKDIKFIFIIVVFFKEDV